MGRKSTAFALLLLSPNLSEPLEDGDAVYGCLVFAAVVPSTVATLGKDDNIQADALLNFVVGDYVIVGREPDGGAPYSGTARVEPRTGCS